MRGYYRLKAVQVKSLPEGKHCDGGGLWLFKRPDGGGQWTFRFTLWGRQREMGLGSVRTLSLAQARQASEEVRRRVVNGEDPVKLKKIERGKLHRVENRLEAIAMAALAAKTPELKGSGEDGRWIAPLRLHVLPKLGKTPVTQIDQHDIRDVLAPIWQMKNETARKALSRLKIVLKHAKHLGYAVDLGLIEDARELLGSHQAQVRHIPALPWRDVPAFYASLGDFDPVQLAMRMLILTGVRSDPVNTMQVAHIAGDVWTVPADFVKGPKGATKAFRVPLCAEASRVIALAKAVERNGYLFPNTRGGALNKMALRSLMVERGMDARPHGFRTSLRTWISDETRSEHDVAEACIGHFTGSEVSKAYNRTDYFNKRRTLMGGWSAFVTGQTGLILNAA